MGVLPEGRIEQVQFYENHRAAWEANAVAIGLTPAQVTALTTLVDAARDGYDKAQVARDESRSATDKFYNQVAAMRTAGAAAIRAIKAKAALTGNPDVYTLAQIPAPLPPGPPPTPGTPSDFQLQLLPTGALQLRWKCNNPSGASGVVYEVQRRLGASGTFQYIGASGSRKFLDGTLPGGTAVATYRITAIRSTARGVTAEFIVNFGVGGDGALTNVTLGQSHDLAGEHHAALGQNQSAASTAHGMTGGGEFSGRRGGGGRSNGANGLSPSTVNGRTVRKSLNGNGRPERARS